MNYQLGSRHIRPNRLSSSRTSHQWHAVRKGQILIKYGDGENFIRDDESKERTCPSITGTNGQVCSPISLTELVQMAAQHDPLPGFILSAEGYVVGMNRSACHLLFCEFHIDEVDLEKSTGIDEILHQLGAVRYSRTGRTLVELRFSRNQSTTYFVERSSALPNSGHSLEIWCTDLSASDRLLINAYSSPQHA